MHDNLTLNLCAVLCSFLLKLSEERAAVPVHDNLSLNLCAALCSFLLSEQRAAVPVHDNLSLNLCAVLCSWLLTEGVPAGHDPTSSDKETSDTEWSDSSHEGCENKSKKALKVCTFLFYRNNILPVWALNRQLKQ